MPWISWISTFSHLLSAGWPGITGGGAERNGFDYKTDLIYYINYRYAWLVAEIRKSNPKANTEELSIAIDRAIAAMPDDFVIRPFLRAHQAEVKGMLLTEYNEAEEMERLKRTYQREGMKDCLRQGLRQGRELTRKEDIRKVVDIYRTEFFVSDKEICKRIMERFALTEEEAKTFL